MASLDQLTKIPMPKKLAILLVFMLLAAVAYYMLYYGPITEELEGLKGQHISLKNQHKDAEKRRATYVADQRKRDELRKTYAQQIRALPPDAEMSSFLNNLNTQAELVGLDILSVKPLAEEAAEYYARIPVNLQLSGTYHELAKFFYLVGNLERVINLENIELKPTSMGDGDPKLTTKVRATTFRSLQPDTGQKG